MEEKETKGISKAISSDLTDSLKAAIHEWDALTKSCFGPARDEREIQEVRRILKELQDKLKAFEENN
jgi:hypothetical protein